MNARFIYKTHKWLGLALLVVTIGWFVSGVFMVMPATWQSRTPELFSVRIGEGSGGPGFEAASITVPDAIAAVKARIGKPVRISGVRLLRLSGLLAYEVSTSAGTFMMDAVTGAPITVDADMALRIARDALGPDARLGAPTLQRARSTEYTGPLPAFRIPLDNGKGTTIFVSRPPVEIRHSDAWNRAIVWIIGWHELTGLGLSRSGQRMVLMVLSAAGAVMTLFGGWILMLQLQVWWRRRRRRNASAASV